MKINGRHLRDQIIDRLRREMEGESLTLAIIEVGDDSVTRGFVGQKKILAERLGVEILHCAYEKEIEEKSLKEEIEKLNRREDVDGIIVQLPLPSSINADEILKIISPDKDVDALSPESRVLSPVVLAVAEVLRRGGVLLEGKKILVAGQGRLVGRPVAVWLTQEGYEVETVDRDTPNLEEKFTEADIIVSGLGLPHYLKPDMIKEGVALIDVGTSESEGVVVGDIDPACEEKASFITPTPGGIGPLTVVMIFQNLLDLSKK